MNLTLIFQVDGRDYGLEIHTVREIVEDPVRFPVPRPAPFLCGAINMHGDVLPVIDLPGLMGTASPARDARLVVLAAEYRGMALTVSRVERIVPLDLARLRTDPDPGTVPGSAWCCARRPWALRASR